MSNLPENECNLGKQVAIAHMKASLHSEAYYRNHMQEIDIKVRRQNKETDINMWMDMCQIHIINAAEGIDYHL